MAKLKLSMNSCSVYLSVYSLCYCSSEIVLVFGSATVPPRVSFVMKKVGLIIITVIVQLELEYMQFNAIVIQDTMNAGSGHLIFSSMLDGETYLLFFYSLCYRPHLFLK